MASTEPVPTTSTPPPELATSQPSVPQAPAKDIPQVPVDPQETSTTTTEPADPNNTDSSFSANTTSNSPPAPTTPGDPETSLPQAPNTPSASSATSSPASPPHSASLYVGDLHPDISEANLYEIFQALGPVQSIRVCRDVVTRRSLGYAYINFHNTTDAERALDTMNYYASPLTKNKPLRMMWMIRDPSQRRTGAGNIFVKSLEKSIDNKSLYDTFSQFGNILSCKVACDDGGNSLGHGFVHFETQEAAQAAIDQVNGKLLEGRKVYVGKFLNKREREAAGHVNKIFTNVYIKNLDDSVCCEDTLRDLFVEFGDITSIHVAIGEEGTPKGFAFINYASPEMAKRAVDEMNTKEIGGKPITVCPAQKKSVREAELRNKYEVLRNERMQKYQGINLYVKNLADDIDDDRLRTEFSPFGTITSCKIMCDDKGFTRGFGFVCFTQPEEATKAVTELNGRMIGQKPIYVALAQRKDVRRAQLEAQRAMNMRIPPGGMPPGAAAAMYAQPGPYMYQQPMHNMGQVPNAAMGAARGGAAYVNAQYVAAMGRGGPAGRGGPQVSPQYMAAMGRGQGAMPGGAAAPGAPSAMGGFGMPQARQPRQNRQRGGPMQGGGPAGGPMVPGRGNGGGRGRGGAPVPQGGAGGAGAAGQQYKYTTNARNANIGVGSNGQGVGGPVNGQGVGGDGNGTGIPSAAGGATSAVAEPLTIEMLTNATPHQQKQMLGERLYPLITTMQPRMGGKITGMLLDMENTEILHLLESPEALSERVDEAVLVLREHAATGEGPNGQA